MSEAAVLPDDTRLATIVAQLALRGFEVYELASGAFVATRWGLTKHHIDLGSLDVFARQIGVTID